MNIKTLEGTDQRLILKAFNESFSDYFTPFELTEEQLTAKMAADKTDLNLSVGVFENGRPVAFILHGFDEINGQKVVYNGGTGVIPEKRRHRLTQQMYQFILPRLKVKRIKRIVLEVITENIPAIRSYERSGFQTSRTLQCYKGNVSVTNKNLPVEIKPLREYDWNTMETFWDIHPTWQNSKSVLNGLQPFNISLGAFIDKQLVGYAVYNPDNKRLHQIAVHCDFRKRKIASALIGEIVEDHGSSLSVINVDESSKPAHAFLKSTGLENYLDQFEMNLELDENTNGGLVF